jgi:choice-of-anchor A domain-containing protein
MTRLRLNWVTQISVLTIVVACGSSNNNGVGSDGLSTVGGQGAASAGGETGANVGGSGASQNGGAGNGTSGSNTAGDNSQAGNNSGTGSTGSTDGGAANLGGDGSVGGDYYSLGGDGYGGTGSGAGGGSSVDVKLTGGSGSTIDVGSGGGSSVDVATGGGFSIDTGSGGGSSVDIATGGGMTIDIATGGGSSIDKASGGGSTIDKATGGGTSVDVPKCLYTDLNSINVYVIENVTAGAGADCEGNMYVGGNMTTSGYSIGAKDGTPDCSTYTLIVGGNVSGVHVYNGSAVAGGTVTNSEDTSCGGVVGRKGTNLSPPLPAGGFPVLEAKVEALSLKLAQLPPNATATKNGSGALVLAGKDTKQNVFNIDASQLGTIVIDVPLTSLVIINVSGTAVNWPAGGFTLPGGPDSRGDYAFATNVIWNFYEALTFYNTSAPIQGTILAPLATFTGGSGHVAGQVIVRNMTSLAVEFHPYYFSGCITWPTV